MQQMPTAYLPPQLPPPPSFQNPGQPYPPPAAGLHLQQPHPEFHTHQHKEQDLLAQEEQAFGVRVSPSTGVNLVPLTHEGRLAMKRLRRKEHQYYHVSFFSSLVLIVYCCLGLKAATETLNKTNFFRYATTATLPFSFGTCSSQSPANLNEFFVTTVSGRSYVGFDQCAFVAAANCTATNSALQNTLRMCGLDITVGHTMLANFPYSFTNAVLVVFAWKLAFQVAFLPIAVFKFFRVLKDPFYSNVWLSLLQVGAHVVMFSLNLVNVVTIMIYATATICLPQVSNAKQDPCAFSSWNDGDVILESASNFLRAVGWIGVSMFALQFFAVLDTAMVQIYKTRYRTAEHQPLSLADKIVSKFCCCCCMKRGHVDDKGAVQPVGSSGNMVQLDPYSAGQRRFDQSPSNDDG